MVFSSAREHHGEEFSVDAWRPEKLFTLVFSSARKHHGDEFLWTLASRETLHYDVFALGNHHGEEFLWTPA